PTLMFSYVATNEPESYRERFKEFVAYLSQKLGRAVEYQTFRSPEEELRALQEGRLHIAGVNTGNIPAAVNQCGFVPFCNLASDILTRAVANGEIKKEQYRVIYESEDFPTAGFGYLCTLKPELAAKVKDAFFSFEWKGTGVEKEFAASQQSKFMPVSYKKDF